MAPLIAFDVNETLLDLRALDAPFQELLGDAALRPLWFAQMLQLSFVGGLTGSYLDFTSAQRAALHMVADRAGQAISDRDVDDLVALMTQLPPHPEVPAALTSLTAAGCTLVALTNSVQQVADAQLQHAGLHAHFDRVLSADTVRRLKPAPEPYRSVADAYRVPMSQVRLVAAHSWDVSGALAAGCCAAFVARPGMVLSPVGPAPDIVGDDLADVAQQILLDKDSD